METDPKVVLAKVVQLAEKLKSDRRSRKKLKLTDLNIPNVCKEVDEMDCRQEPYPHTDPFRLSFPLW